MLVTVKLDNNNNTKNNQNIKLKSVILEVMQLFKRKFNTVTESIDTDGNALNVQVEYTLRQ